LEFHFFHSFQKNWLTKNYDTSLLRNTYLAVKKLSYDPCKP
jgi:hypothetical protein